MDTIITIVHVTAAIILIVIVLLQTGKGASMGAVFGGGSSNTLFGNRGAGNFLTKMTTGAAIIFMLTSLGISILRSSEKTSTIDIPMKTATKAPEAKPVAETDKATDAIKSVVTPKVDKEPIAEQSTTSKTKKP